MVRIAHVVDVKSDRNTKFKNPTCRAARLMGHPQNLMSVKSGPPPTGTQNPTFAPQAWDTRPKPHFVFPQFMV
jgi:hypothetical protein